MSNQNHIIHQMDARQIMEMVQRGYNSLNPKDVQNFINGKPPLVNENLTFFYGNEGLKRSLGEAHMNDNQDFGDISRTFGQDPTASFKYQEDEYTNSDTYKVLGPGGGIKDISNTIRARLESKNAFQKQQVNNSFQRGLNNNKMQNLFETEEYEDQPRQTKPMVSKKISDTKKAGTIGYDAGIDYINEFISLLKEPNAKQRKIVFEKIQEIIESESLFTSEAVKYYKGGINKAEKELWNKIQKKKNAE